MSCLEVILQVRGRDGMCAPQNGAAAYSVSRITYLPGWFPIAFPDGGGGQWLVRTEWRPARWSVCLPLLIFACSCTIKSGSFLAPAHPGGHGKRAVKRLWCGTLHCWLDVKKRIRPVKIEWWGAGVVICLKLGPNELHMVQLMPLPPRHLVLN